MDVKYQHPAEQLVEMMNRVYTYGMTTTSGGNLSVKDAEGNIWITPSSIDKGTLTPQDIMCVHPDGTITGKHRPSVELPFHSGLYKKRPDIRAIVHAHPPALVAYAVARKSPSCSFMPVTGKCCRGLKYSRYALPGSLWLGDIITEQFEQGTNAVMMENHGIVVGAEDILQAFKIFDSVDNAARICLNAVELGGVRDIDEQKLNAAREAGQRAQSCDYDMSAAERALHGDMVRFMRRCCRQGLFTSFSGALSVRTHEGFLVTSEESDPLNICERDILCMRAGKLCGEGTAAIDPELLNAIYKDGDINAVTMGTPPYAMAFAASGADFDARLIPESYIMLKQVNRFAFGELNAKGAERISIKNPVCIEDNKCVLTAGVSLVNAYDRLEVLEYSAKSVLMAAKLGGIVPILGDEIKEIETAFNL